MFVSAEIIATLGVGITLLVSTLGGFAWMISRTDSKLDALEAKLSMRIESLEHEVVEVKIAVARIEGPRPQFLTGR